MKPLNLVMQASMLILGVLVALVWTRYITPWEWNQAEHCSVYPYAHDCVRLR